jgi:hypothetical protein
VRAVRAADALAAGIDLTHKRANQHLLASLLRRRAELLELPVQFVPISPDKVKRTSALDGLQSLLTILALRLRAAPRTGAAPDVAPAPPAEAVARSRE